MRIKPRGHRQKYRRALLSKELRHAWRKDAPTSYTERECLFSPSCAERAIIGGGRRALDRVGPDVRSRIMASVGTKDTSAEMGVRRLVHGLGYRYALHKEDLPGRPDLVFPSRRKIVFVHGCFWHGHRCRHGRLPKSRKDYWGPKLEANKSRDRKQRQELRRQGWKVMVVWQCQLKRPVWLSDKIDGFLKDAE